MMHLVKRFMGLFVTSLVAFCAAGLLSCGQSESIASQGMALLPQHIDINQRFPAGFSQKNVAMQASTTITLADRVTLGGLGTAAPVVNVGTGSVDLGSNSKVVGDAISGGAMFLGSSARIEGNAQAAGPITSQDGVLITGARRQFTALGPLSTLSFAVDFPTPTGGLQLEPGLSASLNPGAYADVAIKSRSLLHLSGGKYFFDNLSFEADSILGLDTSAQPVIVYVRGTLNFKGKIQTTGPARRFLVGYFGTSDTSIESPWNGVIIAPNANLRLAPLNGTDMHRGAFFAKSINVAGAAGISYEPFAGCSGHGVWVDKCDCDPGWLGSDCSIVAPVPSVECVNVYAGGSIGAVFTYDNSGGQVTIPIGPDNHLQPPGPALPGQPTVFDSGHHTATFSAGSGSTGAVSWTIAKQTVTATAAARSCLPGDMPIPSPSAPQAEGSDPIGPVLFRTLSNQGPGSTTEMNFLAGGTTSTITGGTSAKFRLIIHQVGVGSDAICGPLDPYVLVSINGAPDQRFDFNQDCFLPCEHAFEGTVPVGQVSVPVKVSMFERDTTFCGGGDDFEWNANLTVNNVTGAVAGSVDGPSDGGSVDSFGGGDFQVNAPPSSDGFPIRASVQVTGNAPRICTSWNAEYADAGPRPGFTGTEDFANGDFQQNQSVPASFAHTKFDFVHGSAAIHWSGFLDEKGCLPLDATPSLSDLKLSPGAGSAGISMSLKYSSQFCDDPLGAACAEDPTTHVRSGANLWVHETAQTGPESLCVFATQNESETPTDPACGKDVRRESAGAFAAWDAQGNPPPTISLAMTTQSGITRISGVVSQILRREFDTQGGMGVRQALIDRRRSGGRTHPETIEIVANQLCSIGDTCADPSTGIVSIRGDTPPGNQPVCLSDGRCYSDDSYWKFVVAHEIGHIIQARLSGRFANSYGMVGAGPKCSCQHVDSSNRIHCLQSTGDVSAAELEGFAQYFASKTWNRDEDTDCVFKYYV